HFQIELQCHECHSEDLNAGVKNDACIKCHGADLQRSTDTHPKSKFTDPSKAHMVRKLDGRTCLSCHQEHVPDRTLAMGVSLPADYCWHCHQEVGEQRPSHAGMAYDSCATAGCHNYHDNRALFEKFLVNHYGEPDMLDVMMTPESDLAALWAKENPDAKPLSESDADAPSSVDYEDAVMHEWSTTAHAAAGVNCTSCHTNDDGVWSDSLSHDACRSCHEQQVDTFVEGRHGMRLAVGLSPMKPVDARLPMNHDMLHTDLNCVACHGDHEFDVRFAAADGCLRCHDDEHSVAYKESTHYELWRAEVEGAAEARTGVSCATCHMPREKNDDGVFFVQHNQNNNLRPNEKMGKNVCGNCHGLQFTLDALADEELVRSNFQGLPSGRVESIDMAKAWSDERARLREERKRARERKKALQAESAPTAGRPAA
ncbi:MAG: ammonia-forming cytochrome c nitrite reductase subunit c552, partial [Planctomycetota bacterium]